MRAKRASEVSSLLVAALVTRLAKKLAVLLLRHALAALLDDRTHVNPLRMFVGWTDRSAYPIARVALSPARPEDRHGAPAMLAGAPWQHWVLISHAVSTKLFRR